MKQTTNFNIMVPELGDTPDITQVSDAIQALEDALAGTLEIMVGSIQGSALTLTSPSRTTKRTAYYEGMSIGFIAPAQIKPDFMETVTVDELPEQTLSIPFLVNAGEEVFLHYDGTGFVAGLFVVPKSDAVDLDSSDTSATSKAVKIAYDKAVEAFNFATELCPYRIGDVIITTLPESPAVTWLGTVWSRVEGKYLKSTTGEEESMLTGGSMTKVLTADNVPAHTHTFAATTDTVGDHAHSADHAHTGSQPEHAHTAPDHVHVGDQWTINAEDDIFYNGIVATGEGRMHEGYGYGSREIGNTGGAGAIATGGAVPGVTIDAAAVATSTIGAHAHTASGTTDAYGAGLEFNIEPSYYTVHIWTRTK